MSAPDVNFPIALDIVGVVVGSLQGAFFARSQTRVSVIGVAVFAYATAVGGAVIRDALMAQRSAALTDPYLIAWVCATAVAVLIWHLERRLTRVLILLDAAYLGVWAVAGSDKALHLGFGIPAVILLGVITAVGGGLVRDLLAGQTPTLFQAGPLYTIAALIGASLFVGLHKAGSPRTVDAILGVGAVLTLRLLSLHYGWLMPPIGEHPAPTGWRWWRRR